MSLVRSMLAALVGVTLASAPLAAQKPSPFNGTWKLNLVKSKYDPASLAPKAATVVKYTVTATEVTAVADGVDSQGRKTHSEYTAKCDGTVAPWNGTLDGQPNPDQDGISVKCLDTNTLHIVNSLKGKPTITLHNVVSADGKTRTVNITGTNAQGVKINHTAVYDKQ
jgi:hypothetical protein